MRLTSRLRALRICVWVSGLGLEYRFAASILEYGFDMLPYFQNQIWKNYGRNSKNVSIKNLECVSISAFEFPKTFPKNMEIFHNI